jgi:hypothetical protein
MLRKNSRSAASPRQCTRMHNNKCNSTQREDFGSLTLEYEF